MTRALLLVGLAGLSIAQPTVANEAANACRVTEMVRELAPQFAGADTFGSGPWFRNADRTLWAGMGHISHLTTIRRGNKVMWIRPQGTQLTITGRHIDGEAPPLQARVPCCYPGGFQSTGLIFPTEGCWEISAKSGTSELTFVTRVWLVPQEN
jgi:hypothetical protein